MSTFQIRIIPYMITVEMPIQLIAHHIQKMILLKYIKKGERNHNPENTILPIVAVVVVKIDHNIYDKKEKRKKYRHRYEKYSGYDNTNSTNTIPTGSKRKRSRK